MNVWLISAFEPVPVDNARPMRFMGIADALRERGHQVTFWSSSFNHFTKSQRETHDSYIEIKPFYRLYLVHTTAYRKNISLSRLISHARFARSLMKHLLKEEKPDLIYLAFPPISTADRVAAYAREHNIPLVIDIIDPWPDVFLNILPAVLKKPSRAIMKGIYGTVRSAFRQCHAIFSISETYIQWAAGFVNTPSAKYEVFYPAVDTSLYDGRQVAGISSFRPLKIIYAGTLGAYYDLETLIATAGRFHHQEVSFIIAGDGPKRQKLQKLAKGLSNVTFTGWLDSERLHKLLTSSHIGLAAYTRNSTQTVTYKLFDYLAAGLPLLCSLEGEMMEIIRKNKLGYSYEAENAVDLQRVIQKFLNLSVPELITMKKKAKMFALEKGDADNVYNQLVDQLEEIIHAG